MVSRLHYLCIFIALAGLAAADFLPEDVSTGYNGVVDISGYQGTDLDFHSAYGAGIRGIIGKATQGVSYQSSVYGDQRSAAKDAGMLWGAYHFATGDDPTSQAEFFLNYANPDSETLLALDFERNPDGSSMSISQAETFVQYVEQRTGRYPVLYGGYYLSSLLGGEGSSILSKCPLWVASYTSSPSIPAGWSKYTLWQYTDGSAGLGPYTTPGFGATDKDVFNGTEDELEGFWKNSFLWRCCGLDSLGNRKEGLNVDESSA